MDEKLIFTNLVGSALDDLVASLGTPDLVVITDNSVQEAVLPTLMADSKTVGAAKLITVPSGDTNKNVDTLISIWKSLADHEATRHTVVINLGGGMVTDMGGFAAATFKRGMKCINIPTTLLGAVDASVGGKTAINFNGVKNQIGVFAEPVASIISTCFFNTLPQQEILSGYAEMLKHGLLEDSDTLSRLLAYSPSLPLFDSEALMPLLRDSVLTKARIAGADLTEQGLRKALNLGHTVGHAFESLAMARHTPIPHGYAVAWGLVVELVLSHIVQGFDSAVLHKVAGYVLTNYGVFHIDCKDYPTLLQYMRQDKKNYSADQINFTLLEAVGKPKIDSTADTKQIESALDIYRDLMGI